LKKEKYAKEQSLQNVVLYFFINCNNFNLCWIWHKNMKIGKESLICAASRPMLENGMLQDTGKQSIKSTKRIHRNPHWQKAEMKMAAALLLSILTS
jgi:hypothetical protein